VANFVSKKKKKKKAASGRHAGDGAAEHEEPMVMARGGRAGGEWRESCELPGQCLRTRTPS
jgi:hypothetical protein